MELIDCKSKQDMIAETVRKALTGRQFAIGDRLRPDEELATEYGVNRRTVAAALNRLVEEGFLERARRRGTVVISHHGHAEATSAAVGLVMMSQGDFYSQVVCHLLKQLAGAELYPVIMQAGQVNNRADLQAFLQRLTGEQTPPYGFIIDGSTSIPYDYIAANPVVFRNTVYITKYHASQLVPAGAGTVLADLEAAGRRAADYLIRQGRRKLLFLATAEEEYIGEWGSMQVQLMRGFQHECLARGIGFDEALFWRMLHGAPFEETVRELFRGANCPDGFFCYQDATIYYRVLPVLRECGVERPAVDYVGFYNTPQAAAGNFSSFWINEAELAYAVVQILTGKSASRSIKLIPELVVRKPVAELSYHQ